MAYHGGMPPARTRPRRNGPNSGYLATTGTRAEQAVRDTMARYPYLTFKHRDQSEGSLLWHSVKNMLYTTMFGSLVIAYLYRKDDFFEP